MTFRLENLVRHIEAITPGQNVICIKASGNTETVNATMPAA
jgi:hypothetical protein